MIIFKHFGSVSLLAGLTQAFLVPPTIHAVDKDIIESIPFEVEAASQGRLLEVECTGCPIEAAKGAAVSWNHAKSLLRLNFTIEHLAEQPDALKLNGVQIMPVDTAASLQGLHADQLIQAPDGTWAYSSTPELGYSLSIKPYHDGQQDMSIYALHLRIIEVANEFVRHIPAVDLRVISTPTGQLMVAESKIQSSPWLKVSAAGGADCSTLLCKWKAIIASKTKGLKKGCGHKTDRPHRVPRPYGIKGGRPKPEGFGKPHPHGQYHHRRPHSDAFYRFLRALTVHVLVPVLVGMGIGITASVVGMLMGQFIVLIWRTFFRHGERGQCRDRATEETDDGCDEETKGFLEGQEQPPVYQEVIVVEDKIERQ